MIHPDNIQKVYVDENELEIIYINNVPSFDILEYDTTTEKGEKKFIDAVEKAARNSFEYRQMISYFREHIDMNQCAFFKNVNNLQNFKIKIEIHHSPFTLYEISKIVYNKRVMYHESLEVEMVAQEVMFLHYKMMVGLIPLSETVHQLVHNKYLFVPIDKVYGNFSEFRNMYDSFIDSEQKDTLDRIIEMSQLYNEHEHMNILNRKYLYVDMSGSYSLPNLEHIAKLMSEKIDEIKHSYNVPNDNKPNNKVINPVFYMDKEEK